MIKISRREVFSAAHRLYRKEWSDEKNLEIFGKCSHPSFHGHNYILEVHIEGEVDPVTGFVLNLSDLKKIIHEEVLSRFDHRNLNVDCPEFKDLNPTAENIAIVIWNLLRPKIPMQNKMEVVLCETEKNKVMYSGPR